MSEEKPELKCPLGLDVSKEDTCAGNRELIQVLLARHRNQIYYRDQMVSNFSDEGKRMHEIFELGSGITNDYSLFSCIADILESGSERFANLDEDELDEIISMLGRLLRKMPNCEEVRMVYNYFYAIIHYRRSLIKSGQLQKKPTLKDVLGEDPQHDAMIILHFDRHEESARVIITDKQTVYIKCGARYFSVDRESLIPQKHLYMCEGRLDFGYGWKRIESDRSLARLSDEEVAGLKEEGIIPDGC